MDPNFDIILVNILDLERENSVISKDIKELKFKNSKVNDEIICLDDKISEIDKNSCKLVILENKI